MLKVVIFLMIFLNFIVCFQIEAKSKISFDNIIPKRLLNIRSIYEDNVFAVRGCSMNYECYKYNTSCDIKKGLCNCPKGFVLKEKWKSDQQMDDEKLSNFCFKFALLEDICLFDEQCAVKHSICKKTYSNIKKCVCQNNFKPNPGSERITFAGYQVLAHVMCHGHESSSSNLYLITFIVCMMFIITLLISSFIIFRLRTQKQESDEVLDNGVISDDLNYSQNSILNSQNVLIQDDMNSHTNPYPLGPPIGSTQAEFQNDFIAVFPMRQLEPLPEKNNMSY